MSLSDTQRARYARHLLLPELGEAGQLRLCSGRIRHAADRDPGALAVARDYLARAGVGEGALGDAPEVWMDVSDPAQLAARPELIEAARALCGAFAAVEAIKALAGLGTSATLGPEQCLLWEEA
jgi:hypothetical protein